MKRNNRLGSFFIPYRDTMIPDEEKMLTMEEYEPETDIYKTVHNEIVHNIVGIDFNLKCLEIIKQLYGIIAYESEYTSKKLQKEINDTLKMDLV